MLFGLNPGGGFTFGDERLMAFFLLETDLQLSDFFRDDYMLGFGGSAGMALNWQIGVNSSLGVEASRHRIHDIYSSEIKGGFNLYW